MTTITKVDNFDYIIIDCGYGDRFIEKHDNGKLLDNFDVNVNLISIHSFSFTGGSRIEQRENKFYDESEYYAVESITGKRLFDGSYGKLTMSITDENGNRTRFSWNDIHSIVGALEEKHLCGCFNMHSMCDITIYEKNGIKVCLLVFDTESG